MSLASSFLPFDRYPKGAPGRDSILQLYSSGKKNTNFVHLRRLGNFTAGGWQNKKPLAADSEAKPQRVSIADFFGACSMSSVRDSPSVFKVTTETGYRPEPAGYDVTRRRFRRQIIPILIVFIQ
jgi:hypothetical protein